MEVSGTLLVSAQCCIFLLKISARDHKIVSDLYIGIFFISEKNYAHLYNLLYQ